MKVPSDQFLYSENTRQLSWFFKRFIGTVGDFCLPEFKIRHTPMTEGQCNTGGSLGQDRQWPGFQQAKMRSEHSECSYQGGGGARPEDEN